MTRTLLATGAIATGVVLAVGLSNGTGPLPWTTSNAPDSATIQAVRTHLQEEMSARELVGDYVAALGEFYDGPAADLLWTRDGRPSVAAERLADALTASEQEGLNPDSFRTEAVAAALDAPHRSARAAARAELALSGLFLRLAHAYGRGHRDPEEVGLQWDIPSDSITYPDLLASVAGGSDPGRVLDHLLPTLPWYGELKEALAAYREAAREGGWPSVPEGDLLQRGDTSPRVERVRARLTAGMDPEVRRLASAGRRADVYDSELARAVARFQARHGIAVDSMVGESTLQAMNVSVGERIADLTLNLDRLRSIPRSLGPRSILVNVAGFELVVLEQDRPVMEMGVVVGRPEWRTAIFQDEMEYLVVNPYWHVPESIEAEEILPAVREDPGYLEAENLVLVPEGDNFGEPVPAERVDWSDVDAASFPYDFRQEPGPSNALGRVKFMFPNEYNIYLHDTPADHLFQEHFRAFSHGCIRVERPRELAHYILSHASDVPPATFDRLLEGRERTVLDLDETIPVYITYFTAWPGEDGTVHFYPDLYHRDAALQVARRGG